jgi:hypothetical protein
MFYQVAIEAGTALENYAKKHKVSWGDNADWILTIESYAPAILDYAIKHRAWPSTVENWNKIISEEIEQ